MTYISRNDLEVLASELWRRFALAPRFDAEALVDSLDLRLLWEVLDDGEGGKVFGALIPWERTVVLNQRHKDLLEEKPGLRRFTIAHEIAHWLLHVQPKLGQMAFLDGIEHVLCREHSKDPMEVQAEAYASYLLSPTDLLRQKIPTAPWSGWATVYRLAEAFEMTPTAMMVRLEIASLAHRNEQGTPVAGPRPEPGQQRLFPG